ncbi:MAG: hypothetical protein JEZ07_11550 [Phycisphaerae bacterium]|nr:hypothetical protein [Phycisphaerae bacterium]
MNKRVLINILILLSIFGVVAVADISVDDPVYQRLVQKYSKPTNYSSSRWKSFLLTHQLRVNNSIPVQFYGRVVDQKGQGVQGVKVRAVWHIYNEDFIKETIDAYNLLKTKAWLEVNWPLEFSYKIIAVETDKDGCFVVDGPQRHELTILCQKDGYFEPQKDLTFFFSEPKDEKTQAQKYTYEDKSPHIVAMWKKAAKMPRLKEKILSPIGSKKTETKLYVNMSKGVFLETEFNNANFTVEIKASENKIIFKSKDYSFAEVKDEFGFGAPVNGYANHFTFVPQNHAELLPAVYIKTKDGLFGLVKTNWTKRSRDGFWSIEGKIILNLDGQRNLEDYSNSTINRGCFGTWIKEFSFVKKYNNNMKDWGERVVKAKELKAQNKPIEFYGKIIDESEQPVSGLVVKARYRREHEKYFDLPIKQDNLDPDAKLYSIDETYNGFNVTSYVYETVSGEDGTFCIRGISGAYLTIELQKHNHKYVEPVQHISKMVAIQGTSTDKPFKLFFNTKVNQAKEKRDQDFAAISLEDLEKEFSDVKKPDSVPVDVWKRLILSHKQALSSMAPEVFCGRVLDQFGNSVKNVNVQTYWQIYNKNFLVDSYDTLKNTKPGQRPHYGKVRIDVLIEAVTDENGYFLVKGADDRRVVVALQKDDYFSLKPKSFSFDRELVGGEEISFSPFNPQLFHVWKKSDNRPHLIIGKHYAMDFADPAKKVFLDLKEKIIHNEAEKDFDLSIELVKNEKEKHLILRANNGGFAEVEDDYGFGMSGLSYIDEYAYVLDDSSLKIKHYVKSRDGKHYSFIELYVSIKNDAISAISVTSILNPDGKLDLQNYFSDKVATVSSLGHEVLIKKYPQLSKPDGVDREVWRMRLFQAVYDLDENKPIEFYGQVVDDSGKPLDKVDVRYFVFGHSIDGIKSFIETGEKAISREKAEKVYTDEQGHFCIRGIDGYGLDVRLSKIGYTAIRSHEITILKNEIIVHGTCKDHPMQFIMKKDG